MLNFASLFVAYPHCFSRLGLPHFLALHFVCLVAFWFSSSGLVGFEIDSAVERQRAFSGHGFLDPALSREREEVEVDSRC